MCHVLPGLEGSSPAHSGHSQAGSGPSSPDNTCSTFPAYRDKPLRPPRCVLVNRESQGFPIYRDKPWSCRLPAFSYHGDRRPLLDSDTNGYNLCCSQSLNVCGVTNSRINVRLLCLCASIKNVMAAQMQKATSISTHTE